MDILARNEDYAAMDAELEEKIYAFHNSAKELILGVAGGALTRAGDHIRTAASQPVMAEGDIHISSTGVRTQQSSHAVNKGVASGERLAGNVELRESQLAETKIRFANLTEKLAKIGSEVSGYLHDSILAYDTAKEEREKLEQQLVELKQKLKETVDPKEVMLLVGYLGNATAELAAARDVEKAALADKTQQFTARRATRKAKDDTEISIAAQQAEIPGELSWKRLSDTMDAVWSKYKDYVKSLNVTKTLNDGMTGALQASTGHIATFFSALATGSMTASQAFKAMAVSIIRSMIDILAQALAMQAVKSILGFFMGGVSGGGGGGVNYGLTAPSIAPGGLGKASFDTSGVLAMPSGVIKKTTGDTVGAGFLSGLNKATNTTVAQSSHGATSVGRRDPDLTNVWVVAPEARPTMGPRDVVIAITDDMMRGGVTRQLVKQIQAGAA
jgi:lambda family phage tail tape measure protein